MHPVASCSSLSPSHTLILPSTPSSTPTTCRYVDQPTGGRGQEWVEGGWIVFIYISFLQDFRLALKAFILQHILCRPVDPDQAFKRSLASLHHHSTVHRVNVNDSYLTNLHTPRSHNSPASGSPLPGMPMDGIRSRSSTLGSFGPWDSYKALSTSVSFPSSPAFTTSPSVGVHTSDFLSHHPRIATLNTYDGHTSAKDTHDAVDDSSQPLLSSAITLCVPSIHHSHSLNSTTLHNNNLLPADQQPCLTTSTASAAVAAGSSSHATWSLGPDQCEKSPAKSVSEVTMLGGDTVIEEKPVNNIHGCPESLQTTSDMTKLESENVNASVQSMCDTTLTTGFLSTNTNTKHDATATIKQEGSPSCLTDSTIIPLAPTASIETLHESSCNDTSHPDQDSIEASSVDEDALSQDTSGRVSSQAMEVTDASGINQSDAQTPTSLFSNGSACGPLHSSPEDSLPSPTCPVTLGPEALIPPATESEPSLLLRELGKYLPKILQKREGSQRSRFFRLRNWWSQDSRHKSYHGMSLESGDTTLTRRARSISGAIGT